MIKQGSIIAALFMLSFFLASGTQMFEALYSLSRNYEAYQVDEILSVVLLFSGFLFIYSIYMNIHLARAVRRQYEAEANLEKQKRALEEEVEKRTLELRGINNRLKRELNRQKNQPSP